MSELVECTPDIVNVISQNMLLDNTRTRNKQIYSQFQRLNVFINTLRAFDGSLDLVGLQEAATENGVNNGELLAKALGFPTSFFFEHNPPQYRFNDETGKREYAGQGRRGEHVGVCGKRVTGAESVDIGDNRLAVKTHVGSVAAVNHHLRARFKNGGIRLDQMGRIIDSVADDEDAIIFGDTNGHWLSAARRLMYREGFRSAFILAHGRRPFTYPTPAYRKTMYGDNLIGQLRPGIAFEEIAIRGNIKVLAAGKLQEVATQLEIVNDSEGNQIIMPNGASDHSGVYGTLQSRSFI